MTADDVREQPAPDVETLQLVQIVIRSDRSELEDLIEGCFDTCRLGVFILRVHIERGLAIEAPFADRGDHLSAEVLEYFHPKRVP